MTTAEAANLRAVERRPRVPGSLGCGRLAVGCVLLAALAWTPSRAFAADRYALIILGATGAPKYADTYQKWTTTLGEALRTKLAFDADRLIFLSESAGDSRTSTGENVRRAVASLRARVGRDDVLMVVLIGHGTFDGASAKFNLVGPDLDVTEWKQLFDGFPARLIFVNTAGASFPFLEALSGKDRVVITATDSSAQRYDTVFPEFFIAALDQITADGDKNGRVSIWEAFSFASQAVQQWYEQRGQLSTEHPLLDDNGDGLGKEAEVPGPDGTLARGTYLDPYPTTAGTDVILAGLQKRKAAVEAEIDALKIRKAEMSRGQYEAEFEKLAVELARLARVIRART